MGFRCVPQPRRRFVRAARVPVFAVQCLCSRSSARSSAVCPVARSNALQDARRPTHATATVAVAAIVIMAADEAKRFGALLNGVAKRVVFGDGDFSDDVLKNEIYPNADEKSERARARARCGSTSQWIRQWPWSSTLRR